MSKNTVEINQILDAKLLLMLAEIASQIGEHRESAAFFHKLVGLRDKTMDKLAQIVLEEL